MHFDIRSSDFHAVVDVQATPEAIVTGLIFSEGPVWHPRDNHLIFSDMGAGIVYAWSDQGGLSVVRKPSNITNGNCIDAQGRLVSCEHATSCVARIESDGRYVRVLASHYRGKELNSPNDIVVDSQDRIWFTDPTYGRVHPIVGIARDLPLAFRGVYRLDPDGELHLVADDFAQPNGLCFLPGENSLLVNDTERMHIRRYAVQNDGALVGGEVVAEISGEGAGRPDGMKVDADGRIYCTGPGGVHVLTPDFTLLGIIRTPQPARNLCFGGTDRTTLFIAATTEILRLQMRARGL